jgi:quercetin dioxygenase-like cupin family protein
MEVFKLEYPSAPEQVRLLLELPVQQAGLKMGTVRVSGGAWVPLEGYSRHTQTEVSLILKGSLEVECGGRNSTLRAGEVVLIPAGQEHRSRALEDTELVWFWFGKEA